MGHCRAGAKGNVLGQKPRGAIGNCLTVIGHWMSYTMGPGYDIAPYTYHIYIQYHITT